MSQIINNYQQVKQRIADVVNQSGVAVEPRLLAVSKKQDVSKIIELAEAGHIDFGESYAQEAITKMSQTAGLSLIWHFIGPIQSNKVKIIASHFDWVHSIDRMKVLHLMIKHREKSLKPINVLFQLKIGDEDSKSGTSFETIMEMAEVACATENVLLRGLMCIPPPSNNTEQQKIYFGEAKNAFNDLAKKYQSVDVLSMGMSGDLESAISCGSTLVRIGTDIFGRRT